MIEGHAAMSIYQYTYWKYNKKTETEKKIKTNKNDIFVDIMYICRLITDLSNILLEIYRHPQFMRSVCII